MTTNIITIDGSQGEGGGQILRSAPSVRNAFCAKGTKCESPGQRPGNPRNESRFLGRCPRLSHCAALRQTAAVTQSAPTEQKPDKSTALKYPTIAQARLGVLSNASAGRPYSKRNRKWWAGAANCRLSHPVYESGIVPPKSMTSELISIEGCRVCSMGGMPLVTLKLYGCSELTDLSPLANTTTQGDYASVEP